MDCEHPCEKCGECCCCVCDWTPEELWDDTEVVPYGIRSRLGAVLKARGLYDPKLLDDLVEGVFGPPRP